MLSSLKEYWKDNVITKEVEEIHGAIINTDSAINLLLENEEHIYSTKYEVIEDSVKFFLWQYKKDKDKTGKFLMFELDEDSKSLDKMFDDYYISIRDNENDIKEFFDKVAYTYDMKRGEK